MRWESPTEGRSGVPLRFPRPVIPVIAVGMAAAWVAAGSAPAFADQVRSQEFWLSQLNVSRAWSVSQGTGITVAVLSDGVNAGQPGLAGIVAAGPDFAGTGPGPGQMGTAAASLIAGRGTGPAHGAGIIGIAPKAHILSVQVTLDPADAALDSAAAGAALPGAIALGIRYAVAHGAQVIDLPLDPGRPNPTAIAALPIPRFSTEPPQLHGILAAEGGSPAEQQAVAFALSKGVVLVAPAGDNALGTDAPNFPAAYPHVISVGAIDSSFNRGAFSSNQPYVSVLAPGIGVTADGAAGGYPAVSSTAAASAIVSGIAALIKAQYPKLTPLQVQQALTSSTVIKPPGGQAPGSGTGSVDAGRAMLAAAALAAPSSAQSGSRAQPLASPPVPAVAAVASTLRPRLLRAALISLAVLVLLLAAIIWYRSRTRRREHDSARATADWARSTQNAFSPYGPGDSRTEADKMLEYFAAPSSTPTGVSSAFASSTGPVSPNRGNGQGSGEITDAGTGGLGAWTSVAPAPAAAAAPAPRVPARQARVSGTPPWEPAAQPASELPWAAVPGPGTAGRHATPSSARPGADSIWPASPAAGTAAAARPSWEELSARTSAARALPASDPAAPPTPDWDGPAAASPAAGGSGSGSALAGFSSSLPVRVPPTGSGHALNGAPGAGGPAAPGSFEPASAGTSLWSSASGPRSPSGSNWEGLDATSGPDGASATGEAAWPESAGDDAYRSAPAGDDVWPPAGRWQPADAPAQWQLPVPPPSLSPAPASDGGSSWRPADSASSWQPGQSAAAWSAASSDSWPTADSDRARPESGPPSVPVSWEAAPAAAGWAPGSGSDTGWEPSVPASPGHSGGEAAAGFDEASGWRAGAFPPAGDEES
jgi:Subtilase family